MPNELNFMKSRDEKGMPDDEFKKISDEYNKKAEASGKLIQKIIFILLGVLTVSGAAINIFSVASESLPEFSFIWLIAFIMILALFLYDPKVEEDKKYKYETDQKIILKSLQDKIKVNKIRLGAVIFLGILFVIINIGCWWFIVDVINEMSK